MLDRQAILDAIARFGLLLDLHRTAELEQVVARDVVAELGSTRTFSPLSDFQAAIQANLGRYDGVQHIFADVLVEFTHGGRAATSCDYWAIHVPDAGHPHQHSIAAGRCRFEFVSHGDRWLIARLALTEIWSS